MRRIVATTVVGLLVVACSGDDGGDGGEGGGEGGGSGDEPALTEAAGGPTLGPLVSGTASVVDGTFVWTDYAYDDRGANTDEGDRTDIESAGGDLTYAEGQENTADLVQVQIGLDEGQVTVRAVLQTLTDPGVPIVLVGFDADGDPVTGARDLGETWSAGEDDAGLGIEHLAVLRQEGAELLTHVGGSFDDGEPLDARVDPDTNVVEATLPLEPDGATWRAFAAAASGDGGTVLDGGAVLHDLAFVGDEPEYQWQDYVQADVLAGDEAVGAATVEVDFGTLAEGGTDLADATTPGFHTYLYRSALDLGEGVVPAEEDGLEYRGPYQPYLVHVPEGGLEEGGAMTLFLHGLTQNHLGSVMTPDGAYLGTGRPLSEELHLLEQYARDGLDFPPHNLTVWPLARGEGLRYRGIAEQDVLDVLDDASERLSPDPDRIILSGGSMGGIGTFRIGALYPDRFSVAVPVIGLAAEDTEPLLANFVNLPLRQINGAQDDLIPAAGAAATTDLLADLELDFRAWMLDDRGHEAGGFVYDCVYASLPDFVRVTDPAEVHYTVDPAQFVSDPDSGLELEHDGAYWVSGMAVADDSDLGTVEARSLARADRLTEPVAVDRRGRSGPDGGDLCGPNPAVSTGDSWRERAVEHLAPGDPPANEPVVELDLTNLAAVTVDVAGAGLESRGALEVTADTDAEVTLIGLAAGTELTVDDTTVTADDDGTVTFAVEPGATTATF